MENHPSGHCSPKTLPLKNTHVCHLLAAFGNPVQIEVIGNLNFHHVISVAFIAGNGQYLRQSLYASGISAPGISAASEELSISSISLNQLATTPGASIVFYHDFFRRSLLFRLLFG